MTPELVFWGVLMWCGMMAFRYWSNNPPVNPEAEEVQRFASYENRDVTFADYEAQPFALDHDPRPAA